MHVGIHVCVEYVCYNLSCFINFFLCTCERTLPELMLISYPSVGSHSQNSSFQKSSSTEQLNSVFSRFRARHFGEEDIGCNTVDLRTSTIKIDAEDTDLRLCFRIISPSKTYTLQVKDLLA